MWAIFSAKHQSCNFHLTKKQWHFLMMVHLVQGTRDIRIYIRFMNSGKLEDGKIYCLYVLT